jgi:hypothetical protein
LIGKKVKLIVKVEIAVANGHKAPFRVSISVRQGSVPGTPPPPRGYLVNQPHGLHSLTFGGKQVGLGDTKDFGKSADVYVGHNGALHLNVGQHIAGDVAPQQLKLRDQFLLCPTSLVAKFDHRRSDDVCITAHDPILLLPNHRAGSTKPSPATFDGTSDLRWITIKMIHRNRKP